MVYRYAHHIVHTCEIVSVAIYGTVYRYNIGEKGDNQRMLGLGKGLL